MPGNTIFFQLILHQALGYAEQFRGFGLYEVGADERAADKRGFDALKGIGKIKLHRKQIHGALELQPSSSRISAGRSSRVITSPGTSTRQRSTTFCNCRMLPGHS